MKEIDEQNIKKLITGLKTAEISNNKVQKEFCAALLQKYIDDGVDINEYISLSEISESIKEGVKLFKTRKKKFYITKILFSLFTGISCFIFVYLYLLVSLPNSLFILFGGTLIDYFIKLRLNRILFVVETRKEYAKKIDVGLLNIRKSEEVTKLWF